MDNNEQMVLRAGPLCKIVAVGLAIVIIPYILYEVWIIDSTALVYGCMGWAALIATLGCLVIIWVSVGIVLQVFRERMVLNSEGVTHVQWLVFRWVRRFISWSDVKEVLTVCKGRCPSRIISGECVISTYVSSLAGLDRAMDVIRRHVPAEIIRSEREYWQERSEQRRKDKPRP